MKNARSERGNPMLGFLNDRCEKMAVMRNLSDFFRKIVFTVLMLVWSGVMSPLLAQQICIGETYEIAVKIHYATTLKAEWVTGNEGTGTLLQPQLEENGIWTWLYATTPQDADKTIKVRLTTDFIDEFCESAEKFIAFTVTECNRYTVSGTVFPFVHTGSKEFDDQFETVVNLYHIPPIVVMDRIGFIRRQIPLHTVAVTYYDCTLDEPIIGAPKHPGSIGNFNNPGLPIRWKEIGITNPGKPNEETLSETERCPSADIGKFSIENLPAGEYVIEIDRKGFLPRYGVITVTGDMYSGHREILAGDPNGDLIINEKDLSATRPKMSEYGSAIYDPGYDFNGDKSVDNFETDIIRINLGAISTIYQETADFAHP